MTPDGVSKSRNHGAPGPQASTDLLRGLLRLRSITALVERDLRSRLELNLGEHDILSLLLAGPLPQGTLTDRSGHSGPAVSRWLSHLVREGWVTRHHLENNRREHIVNVTRRGLKQLERAHQHLDESLRSLLDEIDPYEKQLLVSLGANLTQLLRDCSDPE